MSDDRLKETYLIKFVEFFNAQSKFNKAELERLLVESIDEVLEKFLGSLAKNFFRKEDFDMISFLEKLEKFLGAGAKILEREIILNVSSKYLLPRLNVALDPKRGRIRESDRLHLRELLLKAV